MNDEAVELVIICVGGFSLFLLGAFTIYSLIVWTFYLQYRRDGYAIDEAMTKAIGRLK